MGIAVSTGAARPHGIERGRFLVPGIATHEEVKALELGGILEAATWTLGLRLPPESVLSEAFVRALHKRMFGQLWRRAGKFRATTAQGAVAPEMVGPALDELWEEARSWITDGEYDADETAVRIAHRLLSIRCFDHGNARHARLFADVLLRQAYRRPPFTWGSNDPRPVAGARSRYLDALREADEGDFESLVRLARS